MKLTHPRLQMLLALSLSAVMVRGQILPPGPPIVVPAKSPAAVPVKAAATATPTVAGGIKANAPRDMKLLIVAVDGTEPAYAAIKSFIETLGIPYQTAFTVNPSATGAPTLLPLPPLTDAAVSKGYFQGIILTSGNLAYCNAAGTCTAGLTAADWSRLENYARDFGVRLASYYTWPEARYGLAFSKGVATDTIPQTA